MPIRSVLRQVGHIGPLGHKRLSRYFRALSASGYFWKSWKVLIVLRLNGLSSEPDTTKKCRGSQAYNSLILKIFLKKLVELVGYDPTLFFGANEVPSQLGDSPEIWCATRDSNSHARRHPLLRRTCLPVPASSAFKNW